MGLSRLWSIWVCLAPLFWLSLDNLSTNSRFHRNTHLVPSRTLGVVIAFAGGDGFLGSISNWWSSKRFHESMGMIKHVHYVSVYLHLWFETCSLLYDEMISHWVAPKQEQNTSPTIRGRRVTKHSTPQSNIAKISGNFMRLRKVPYTPIGTCHGVLETPKNIPQQQLQRISQIRGQSRMEPDKAGWVARYTSE